MNINAIFPKKIFFLLFISFKLFYGTGSYPLRPNGWQDKIRFRVNHPPFMAPYFCKASIPYTEQVGIKRQVEGNNGDIALW